MSLTFDHDVAPHLKKGLEFRAKRAALVLTAKRKLRACVWWFTIVVGIAFWAAVAYTANTFFV